MNILFIKTSSLGDVVHNLPVINDILQFANIREHINFDWCVEKSFSDIVRLHPKIRNICEVNLRAWKKNIISSQTWKAFFSFKQQLQSEQYDYIIDTQGLLKSAILAKLANGKKYSYDKTSIRESIAANFYDFNYFVDTQLHAVNRNRLLVANVFDYNNNSDFQNTLNSPDYGIKNHLTKHQNQNLTWLQNKNSQNKKIITFLTATSRDDKLWANENWISLGNHFSQDGFFIVLPAGSNAERQRAEQLSQQIPNSLVAPPLDLQTLAILLNSSTATIGVDTGLTHLSLALEIPTIAIYTATNPQLTGVFGRGKFANVGNIGQIPTPTEILQIFTQML